MPKETLTAETIAGRYQLISRISSGGMGEVHRARDNVLGRTVAVKILPSHLSSNSGFVERFRAEAQAAGRLSHPNVVQIHDWGEWEATYYMVMEYVRGKNLRQILSGRERLEPGHACQVIDQVLIGLEAAHREGLVHRDIKPENILISYQGIVKVTDFGIARAAEGSSSTSGLFGTVAYVAPEQVRSDRIDARTDIYSTGCLFYELLTGSVPFAGDAARVLHQHLNEPLAPPSSEAANIPEDIDRIVVKATEKEPDNRYASASEMRSQLGDAVVSLPSVPPLTELTSELTSEVAPESQPTIAGVVQKRKKIWPKLLIGLVVLLAITIAWMIRPMKVPKVEGLDQQEAVALLAASGLDSEVRPEFDSALKPGTVMRSDPKEGQRARRGSTVLLFVSKGAEVTTLKDLRGLTLEAAKAELRRAGLLLGQVEEAYSNEAAGIVLEQSAAGSVRAGDPVNLVVSQGPEIVEVPDVTGRTWEDAQSILQGRGLQATKAEEFNDAAAGQGIGQSPSKGSKVNKGSSVTVTVSKGPEPFQMPDVRGKTCIDAKRQLESLGLVVVVRSPDGKGTCGNNKVSEQDPFPGATVRKGQEANLYVG